ncbi:NYN domain-containing protein [Crepidotus variabilis]|uniref:NYN domain-containing protein n=1 Tax=Crepidotus variabilis TaxID=179855 RepID=A0A9P6EP59_9AGAR|nr:NYN domain-containing protein [Crepidotus variabilis]
MANLSDDVAIFWDYENCPIPSNASGYAVANAITSMARPFGKVRLFRAYLEIADQLPLRSELQSSGVTLVDCPHNGRKDVADKMILVDMLMHAIDNPTPCTIIIISGDRDFAYALSMLKVRHWQMVLVTLPNAHASLTSQASLRLDWATTILNPKIKSKPPTLTHHGSNMGALRRMGPPLVARNDCGHTSTFTMPVIKPTTVESSRTISPTSSVADFPLSVIPAANLEHSMPLPQEGANKLECISEAFGPPISQATLNADQDSSDSGNREPLDEDFLTEASSDIHKESESTSGEILQQPEVEDYPANEQLELQISCHEELGPDLVLGQPSLACPTVGEGPEDDKGVLPRNEDDYLPSVSDGPSKESVQSEISSLSNSATLYTNIHASLEESNFDALEESSTDPPDDEIPGPQVSGGSTVAYNDLVIAAEDFEVEYEELQLPQEESPSWNSNSILPSSSSGNNLSGLLPVPSPQRQIPLQFVKLVQILQAFKNQGEFRPLRSDVALQLNVTTYQSAGVNKFSQYVDLAVAETIVKIGCKKNRPWIGLQPDWYNAVPAIPEPQIIPLEFIPLVQTLQMFRQEGFSRAFNGQIAGYIPKMAYQQAGVKKFGQYIDLAATRGIVKMGGSGGQEWIALQSKWRNAVPMA